MSFYERCSDNRARRYARACNRVLSGIIGRDASQFYRCVLTTRLGDANDWSTMQKHLRKLIQQLGYRGVVAEYVFLPHIAPMNKLLHLDGLVRIKSGSVSKFELQVLWAGIHGATQVEFTPLRVMTEEQLVHYITSHMFKDYDEIVGFKGRMLVSKGWMPKGWLALDKMLTSSALNRLYDMGPAVWDLKKDLYRRWLLGEVISVKSMEYGQMVRFQRIGGE
jgi:hypothetical protein